MGVTFRDIGLAWPRRVVIVKAVLPSLDFPIGRQERCIFDPITT
jgi:hypothetical protein